VSGVLSSLRYLLADFIGEEGGTPPFLPDGLPDGAAPVVSDGIHRMMEYQGAGYAQLYVDRSAGAMSIARCSPKSRG
jgi:hypothetical protein